jgi:hypothetical protein
MILESLFAGKPPDDFILVWSLKHKRSHWTQFIECIGGEMFDGDTYFGLGTSAIDYGSHKRCPADAVAGIGALWLDIDIAGPGHTKTLLPATQIAALELLTSAFPTMPPSYLIDSGHGLQAYWLLDQWHAITDANRQETKQLLIDFNAYWRAASAKAGYDADSVCDLARVMRVPGTTNCKVPDDIRPVVELVSKPEIRYSWSRLRFFVPKSKTIAIASEIHSFEDQWEGLKLSDKRFEQTWNLARPDLKDQSASSYEMSLGRLAINAGSSDQFAAELMKQFRRQHGLKNKDHARAGAIRKIHETPSGWNHEQSAECSIIRYDSSPPSYRALTPNTTLAFGPVDGITDQKKCRNTVAAAIGHLPPTQKGDDWDDLINAMFRTVQQDTAGPESTEQGQCLQWIEGYLQGATMHNDKANAKIAGEPWTEDGYIYISGAAFRRWIAFSLGDKVDSLQLAIMLKNIGAEPSAGAWKLPEQKRDAS